ncbi:unnamed protein product [Notodromas monacha]|uniref:Nudix hydrolase domain-containing protein n=1 Tax=Notodromas monacha TaxID=399045 RepID=A0A7R9BC18_9CRUS|nr:unnamed protein product [Notodromas monacha]CAG0912444.1 unnamed protein product [Notodromas monacha]
MKEDGWWFGLGSGTIWQALSCWEIDVLKGAGFPLHSLPKGEEPRFKAGKLKEMWCGCGCGCGVPVGTSVGAAFGDLQCAVQLCIHDKNAVLNISTSAQLGFFMKPDFKPKVEGDGFQPIQYWQYLGKTFLAVAAGLNGGNVLAKWIAMFSEVFKLVGVPAVADDILWQESSDCESSDCVLTRAAAGDDALNTNITASPLLVGERHLPASRGSISNVGPDGFSASGITHALCHGIKILRASGVQGILGTGSALIKSRALRDEVGLHFELPFVLRQSGDVAVMAGHADPGENDMMQTALGQTEEEAGLRAADLEVDSNFRRTLEGEPKSVIYWLAKLRNPTTPVILSEERRAFQWLGLMTA